MLITDTQAVEMYPQDAHWYNKLYLSCLLGYRCGISMIPETGTWIVRPIINLDGMSRKAVIAYMEQGTIIDSDMFYCEVFTGRHITMDYVRVAGCWTQQHTFEGFNTATNLIQFTKWVKVDYEYAIPDFLHTVTSNHINIEIKGDHIIEVHLRPNPDPVMYTNFWPIWSETQQPPFSNYKIVADRDSHNNMGRQGFFVPNNE